MTESAKKMAQDAARKALSILDDPTEQEEIDILVEDQYQCIPDKLKREDILKDQGCYETEVSPGCKGGLRKCFIDCHKNPGHANFIPIKEFNKEHLPARFRDDDLVSWIRGRADLTVCVKVGKVSEMRPETFPNTKNSFPYYNCSHKSFSFRGTGYVGGVYKYSEMNDKICQCEECREKKATGEPKKKVWGEILIVTAAHVVYDETESRETTCYFFYDENKSDLKTSLMLKGLSVLECYVELDKCMMTYATHDIELLDMLDKMVERCKQLAWKVSYKFMDVSNDDNISGHQDETAQSHDSVHDNNICICISHPHGREKHVSLGSWTQREICKKGNFQYLDGRKFNGECTQYSYTTPTCRGSSGALLFSPVRRLACNGMEWAGLHHPHCIGRPGSVNTSGFGWEAL